MPPCFAGRCPSRGLRTVTMPAECRKQIVNTAERRGESECIYGADVGETGVQAGQAV